MNKRINKVIDILTAILIVLAIFVTFTLIKRNSYGYFETGVNTYTIQNNELIKIKSYDYNSLNVGDKIYYYIQTGYSYKIASDEITFKSVIGDRQIYVLKNNPDKTIPSERVIGKKTNSSKILGVIFGVLTSKKGYTTLIVIPLLLITIYKIYNLLNLEEESKSPIKLKPPIKLSANNISTNRTNKPIRKRLERIN